MKTSRALDLTKAMGLWLSRNHIVWPASGLPEGLDPTTLDWRLHWSRDGGIDPWASEPLPWQTAPLRVRSSLPARLAQRLPAGAPAIMLEVPRDVDVRDALKGQVALVVQRPSGRLVNASALQIAGVLDDVYADAAGASLGVRIEAGRPSLRVWAPTAHRVTLLLWRPGQSLDAEPERIAMDEEPDGCWSVEGEADWSGARYLYEVVVFVGRVGRVVTNRVTDPYSIGLTENSTHSLVLDLDDPALAPAQWTGAPQPRLERTVDMVSYELHVRDFSRSDKTLPADLRGTYLAFARDALGVRHLRRLKEAGLNTVQLLPIFDFTSAEEVRDRQSSHDRVLLRAMAPDSEDQQRYIGANSHHRAFNWGYDPWHFMAPEGSYASSQAVGGAGRVREVREMIGALHGLGLRVVLDQVYNHTHGADQASNSVLGRLVPGYYHRLDADGGVHTSTCCPNVATEHKMAEKLMVDACVLWARHYKVDGFRFDLMGHHSRANMVAVRAALDALTPERDGVDGRAINLYGEGWDFGEVAGNALFVQATQGQLGGTGIGTFNDRLRDAVRGGGPFDADPRLQGFGTGLSTAPNASRGNGNSFDQRDRLLHDADLVQLSLAGNLRSFTFVSQRYGRPLRGDQLDYSGHPAGYADSPDEVVNYVDAHDNETLYDALAFKLPVNSSMADRIRANTVCLAFPTLGQSPVMWHAGTDFLRSKSLDRNSYDSGDWFNYLDFSLTSNGFGAGLPPASDNRERWPLMRPLLGMSELRPTPADLSHAHELALDLLRLRASSRLFRLGDADQIRRKVSFPVSGTWAQVPGTILMLLDDTVGEAVDDRFARILVAFNGSSWPVRLPAPGLTGRWALHPVQSSGADAIVRASRASADGFAVPGRTVAVFVEPR